MISLLTNVQKRWVCLWCVLLCSGMTACGGIDIPFPEERGEVLSSLQKEELRKKLKTRSEDLQTLKALARVKAKRGEESQRFRYLFAYESPQSLRIDILPDPGAYTLGVMLTNGQGHVYLDANKK